ALHDAARCHAVKQPGHGSPGLGKNATLADWADHLAGHLDEAGIERAVLVGHSMGGMLVQETFRRHPARVEKVVLVSTTDKPRAAPWRPTFPAPTSSRSRARATPRRSRARGKSVPRCWSSLQTESQVVDAALRDLEIRGDRGHR